MRIVIFGGSFDPVHNGHLKTLAFACRKLRADRAIVVPTSVTPLKERSLSPADHRVAMLRLALKPFEACKVSIDLGEVEAGGVSYAIDTVRRLAAAHPKDELFLLIGTDQAEIFDAWKNAHHFARYCKVVCADRGAPSDSPNIARYGMIVLGNPPFCASSTDTRARFDALLTPPSVNDYINDNLLYLDERVRRWQRPERWQHTVAVAETIALIADGNGFAPKQKRMAVTAAYYHDLAKDFANSDLESYAEKYLGHVHPHDPELLHAVVGADYCSRFYGFKKGLITKAIANHTVPPATGLTALDKALYVADKVEPNRKYDERAAFYKLALKDLDAAFARVFTRQYERFNFAARPDARGGELYASLKKRAGK